MRILFVLPGLHKIHRGAEIAFIAVARELARLGDDVTLIGSGAQLPGTPYRFIHADCISREKFEWAPALPILRNDCAYEELTFLPGLLKRYVPADYDVTLTCGYPFVNWALRARKSSGKRPAHVFVTQNGDWPAQADDSEYRLFGCDGLVCTNPEFFERNKARWRSALIPNGVDAQRFSNASAQRCAFALPADKTVVLMVSALVASKRVKLGIEAVSRIAGAHLIVAGDGPERGEVNDLADQHLPGRFTQVSVSSHQMPSLYKSADVFLHLSRQESFGNVYLEAMAAGLPVVAPDNSRVRWIVGNDQFLCPTDTGDDISHAIERAIAAGAQESSGRIADFTWDKIGRDYRKFLGELTSADDMRSHRSDPR